MPNREPGPLSPHIYPVIAEFDRLRAERGISIASLSIALGGYSRHNISKIRTGRISPSLTTLYRLAEAIGCEIQIVPKEQKNEELE